MAESTNNKSSTDKPPADGQNRRRALLVALAGAGVPLSEWIVAGKWVTPVVDAVVVPAHAQTSDIEEPESPRIEFPLRYGNQEVATSTETNRSLFADVIDRTEEEILNLFISAAEAANDCGAGTSCAANGPVTVDVVATIDGDPSSTACVKARVNFDEDSSCAAKCQLFTFDATVNGETVTVVNNCDLTLTNMTYNQSGFQGNWSYTRTPITEKTGGFSVPLNSDSGCDKLTGCVDP